MSLVTVEDCGFRFPDSGKWAFRHVDFSIAGGDVVSVEGRNGAGKSTLLKTLCGQWEPTEGRVVLGSGVKVVYMDQFAGEMLAKGLTIAEHFKASQKEWDDGSEVDPRELLARFEIGLQDRMDDFAGFLSGGEKQIIALLCTVASGAKALCLDEFVSALDSRSSRVANSILEYLSVEFDVALVLVSHIGVIRSFSGTINLSSESRSLQGN